MSRFMFSASDVMAVGVELVQLCIRQEHWSQETFGSDKIRGPRGGLEHLKKEVQEAIDTPDDPLEYADCLLLVIDSARRAGFGIRELLLAASTKQQINEGRLYSLPVNDEPVEHVRDCWTCSCNKQHPLTRAVCGYCGGRPE